MDPIIVGVDGSPPSERALCAAIELAEARRAPLRLVHALTPPVAPTELAGYASSQLWTGMTEWAEQLLAAAKARVPTNLSETTALEVGTPADVLTTAARQAKAGLIVVGTVGAGAAARLLLGSTAHKVVHTSTTPVLVVRPDGAVKMRSFFVAVDESNHAVRAARVAAQLAAEVGGELTLVHVSMPNLIPDIPTYHSLIGEMEAEEDRRAQRLFSGLSAELSPFNVPIKTRRLVGSAEAFIEDAEQRGAHCLVVGSRGRNAVARVLLGSFADRVLNASKRNVLVVR